MTTRREFIRDSLAMTPLLGLMLPSYARSGPKPSGRLVCVWSEEANSIGPVYYLQIGYSETMEEFPGRASLVDCVLFRNSSQEDRDDYTFRFGYLTTKLHARSLDDAKRLAEQQTVAWMRQMLVEMERFAFRIV